MQTIRRALVTTTLAWTLIASFAAMGQEPAFPSRTITIVVPFTGGGGVDVMGRLLADKLRASLGQQVIVALAAVETQLEVELLREGGVMPSILKKAMVKETA